MFICAAGIGKLYARQWHVLFIRQFADEFYNASRLSVLISRSLRSVPVELNAFGINVELTAVNNISVCIILVSSLFNWHLFLLLALTS